MSHIVYIIISNIKLANFIIMKYKNGIMIPKIIFCQHIRSYGEICYMVKIGQIQYSMWLI